MRKSISLLGLGILVLFLISDIEVFSYPVLRPPPGLGSPTLCPTYYSNDAGYAYNVSLMTFFTTLVYLTGTFEYNSTEGGFQAVEYYIALGQIVSNNTYGACYIQPVIIFATCGKAWGLYWEVQAWGNNNGKICEEYNNNGLILYGNAPVVDLDCTLNLTIKATLNCKGEIVSAWVYIESVNTGQVFFSQTINLKYPIPDKQVFLDVEDPLSCGKPVNFPIIPSTCYIFVKATVSNSSMIIQAPPFGNGVLFIMKPPHATAYVVPKFFNPQGVVYYW